MKYVRCFLLGLLVASLVSVAVVPASASDVVESSVEVVYYEDGSYLTTELTVYDNALSRTKYSVSATKTVTYRNSSNDLLWDFSVNGTFIYDGSTATATDASYSYTIYHSAWVFKSATASCTDNVASATGKFRGALVLNRTTTVTLTCDPDGNIS